MSATPEHHLAALDAAELAAALGLDWSSLPGSGMRRTVVNGRPLLVKWRRQPPHAAGWPPFFAAEARGLALLGAAQAMRVPRVYAHAPADGARPAVIVMEWIDRAPLGSGDFSRPADRATTEVVTTKGTTTEVVTTKGTTTEVVTTKGATTEVATTKGRGSPGEILGRQLAALHRVTADAYGLDHNNYCGDTLQDNGRASSWIEFYGQRRLGFQLVLASQRGLLPRQRRQRLERLIGQLGRWIDESACQPSLLHGDLWGGNWLVDAAGQPALIDPAVYYGDREAELAMCRLFGGFPPEFYRAYDEAWPPAPGRDERVPLYQLYHLLNHLNLFGEGYGAEVDRILQRYGG